MSAGSRKYPQRPLSTQEIRKSEHEYLPFWLLMVLLVAFLGYAFIR